MFENKSFLIEVVDKQPTEHISGKPVDESVKELIVYSVKAVGMLIVVGGVVRTISEVLINRLS